MFAFTLTIWLLVSAVAWLLAFYFAPPSPVYIKTTHVVVFFVWTWPTLSLLRRIRRWPDSRRVEVGLLCIAAGLIELSEIWIPNHWPDLIGYTCSCVGVCLAVWTRGTRAGDGGRRTEGAD
jgi:peptidoglycan/LPS O-acetylase OafA/YrhL